MIEAIFSDIDGTLLTSALEVSPATQRAISALGGEKIPFVPVSARSPSGIYPILDRYGFRCPLIVYSGALILDENREILYENGMSPQTAARVLAFLDASRLPLVWNLYSVDDWVVRDRSHPYVVEEERAVEARAREGSLASVAPGADIHKILVMCEAGDMDRIEGAVKAAFPGLSVARSWPTLLEIMAGGVNKAEAVRWFCARCGISIENAAAFGDNYNDVEMLAAVGFGVAMGNAPEDVRRAARSVTSDNDHDGIAEALLRLGVL